MMKRFFVGVKGVVVDPNRGALLLGRDYSSGNFWDTPGGRIDGDENFSDTLKRELIEELPGCSAITIGDFLGATRIHKDIEPDTGLVLLYFKVRITLPDPIQLSEEHSNYTWISKTSDIPKEINEELAKILQKVLEV